MLGKMPTVVLIDGASCAAMFTSCRSWAQQIEAISQLKAPSSSSSRVAVGAPELAQPRDLEIFKQNYDTLALVGSGAFGSVYCAR